MPADPFMNVGNNEPSNSQATNPDLNNPFSNLTQTSQTQEVQHHQSSQANSSIQNINFASTQDNLNNSMNKASNSSSLSNTNPAAVTKKDSKSKIKTQFSKLFPTDKISLNVDYKHKQRRVNIYHTPLNTTEKQEEKRSILSIDRDRENDIQCCLVRIMKTRKQCEHSQLVAESIEQLKARFQPKMPMIKKVIDTLIEKEYLERDPDNRNMLKYIA